MKTILFASIAFVGPTGAALPEEGGCDHFGQVLPGALQAYAVDHITAPAGPVWPAPAYARLLSGNGTMAGLNRLDSRPVGAMVHGYARKKNG